SMNALVIGGTRNLGPGIVQALLAEKYSVSVLNRGQTPGSLPPGIERLFADRSNASELKQELGKRDFDLVVDTTLYNGADAASTVEIFHGRVGSYVFISTGQVYLVLQPGARPFHESAYNGTVMPCPPKSRPSDVDEWLYGTGKREA